jgi:hypothetical protein
MHPSWVYSLLTITSWSPCLPVAGPGIHFSGQGPLEDFHWKKLNKTASCT